MSESTELPGDLSFLHTLMIENGYIAVRPIGGGMYAAVAPYAYTHAIIVGRIGDAAGFENRWCYHSRTAAVMALEAWLHGGQKDIEPKGWHRQPGTGRRLAETDDCYDDDDQLVPIGTIYTRA